MIAESCGERNSSIFKRLYQRFDCLFNIFFSVFTRKMRGIALYLVSREYNKIGLLRIKSRLNEPERVGRNAGYFLSVGDLHDSEISVFEIQSSVLHFFLPF